MNFFSESHDYYVDNSHMIYFVNHLMITSKKSVDIYSLESNKIRHVEYLLTWELTTWNCEFLSCFIILVCVCVCKEVSPSLQKQRTLFIKKHCDNLHWLFFNIYS